MLVLAFEQAIRSPRKILVPYVQIRIIRALCTMLVVLRKVVDRFTWRRSPYMLTDALAIRKE
jgi:hypothetical protein